MSKSNYKKEISEMLAVFEDQPQWPHLSSELGLQRYIKMADEILRTVPAGKVLDWGAGCGQMSYLLSNRGFEVVGYDLDPSERPLLKNINKKVVVGQDPVKLPFSAECFDVVLSSGVLEHVDSDDASLKEISRVLKKDGTFLIYMLPNKYSYIEFLSDRLGRGDHPIKYSRASITNLLGKNGFQVLSIGYQNFFPYNLKGFPKTVQKIYHYPDRLIGLLDQLFVVFPLFRHFSTNLKIVAKKK